MLETQIQEVHDKLQQLLKQHHLVKKENQRLQKENERLNEQLTAHSDTINQLHQKMDAAKLNLGDLNNDSKKELEKRINGYIKEIDRCLSLLNN
jgi:chromosome segregation ATPase